MNRRAFLFAGLLLPMAVPVARATAPTSIVPPMFEMLAFALKPLAFCEAPKLTVASAEAGPASATATADASTASVPALSIEAEAAPGRVEPPEIETDWPIPSA